MTDRFDTWWDSQTLLLANKELARIVWNAAVGNMEQALTEIVREYPCGHHDQLSEDCWAMKKCPGAIAKAGLRRGEAGNTPSPYDLSAMKPKARKP